MTLSSQDTKRYRALFLQAVQENSRCESLQNTWQGIDHQLADNCAFDAGVLHACQLFLTAVQNGDDMLTAIAETIDRVAELNDERAEATL